MTKIFPGKVLIFTLLLIITLIGTSLSYGQQSSEQFIPIGQSPGISGKLSYIGSIVEVNRAESTLVVESNRGTKTIKVTPETRYWLDRSKTRQANRVSSYEDCEVGRKVEVKHAREDESIADWIKIESG